MKTILVLTDFSISSDNTVHYAFKLAQKLKANLLLCNVFVLPSATPMAMQIAWPFENYETLAQDSNDDLNEAASRLNNELNIEILMEGGFRPNIEMSSKPGFVADTINEVAASHDVVMVVMGMHNHRGLSGFLSGDHAKDVIEKANYPVLLLPNQARFKDFKKIAFATDLTHTDIDVLHSLSGLAKCYNSEIVLIHVADESLADQETKPSAKTFLGLVSSKVDHDKIYYRPIRGKDIAGSLDWMVSHIDVDMLVMVHRKKGFFRGLFEGSITQKIADHLTKPLLVFPCSKVKDTMPVF